jgi:chromosome segregation ATPase
MQMQEYIKSLEEALRGKGIPLENDHLSSEELRRAQAEKDMLENEVQRLMMENSELKKDISKKSEMLKQTKFEKEATVVQMQRLVEGANISSDLLNELNISERDLEKVKSEREEIALLKKSIEESGKEISLLRAKISGYQQSPLKFTRPKRSLPSVAEDSEQEFAFDEGHDVAHHVADDEFAEEECDDFHPSVLDFALEEDEGAELKKLLKEKAETEQDYEYNQSQFESHMRNLDLELKSKQDLITALVQTREEAKNLKKNYEKKISDLELEIERIQDQKDIIATKMLSSQADDLIQLEADKAKYEHKLKTMKDQLSSFQDKLKESERRARVQKQEESQIRNLQMEINNIKNQKVRLQKKMKEDADKHREWRESIERQLKALNKKERMNEIEVIFH